MAKTSVPFSELVGQTLSEVVVSEEEECVSFVTDDGKRYEMLHYQDCCESVTVDDVCGDTGNLIGAPIVVAEERSNSDGPRPDGADDSWTWTFYELRTALGSVTIRWFGTSNGYYSEEVEFVRIPEGE